jgi:putative serine protease PepD
VAAAAVVSAFALLTAGYLGRDAVERDSAKTGAIAGTNTSTTAGTQNTTPIVPSSGDEPVVAVAQALSPAVVQIQTQEGLGSGVVYDGSGLIVTNQHVVGTAKTVQVNLSDGTKLQGTVQGADASSDIAVVKIDPSGKTLTVAKLADGEPLVGSIAVAIGSPFGLTGTVTAGVISAVDRPVENERNVSVNMIQTDAPINPGNSGGALANRNGEVIGINAEIYSQSGENNGIGFAIPIQTAKTVADEITSGKITGTAPVERATLGVSIQASPTGDDGAYVANVVSGSGADKAGLQAGDLIVGIDGQQITSAADLSKAITSHQPGDKVTLEFVRDGKTGEVTATLGTSN